MRPKWQKLRNYLVHFARTLLPLGLLVGLGVYFIHGLVVKEVIVQLQNDSAANLGETRGLIAGQLKLIAADIRYLSRLDELREYLDNGNPAARRHLENEFTAFADEYRYYDQIRLLGPDGHELIRVNYSGGKAVLVPEAELQDKSERPYYRESLRLKAGEIYVSPLDLNIEKGKIEIPFKPVLRLAAPVADSSGTVRGFLVLNLLGSALLDNLRLGFSGSPSVPMLLNHEGYWLSGPDPEKEWAFLLGRDDRFGRDYPDVWEAMSGKEAGSFRSDRGLFGFQSLSPAGIIGGEAVSGAAGTENWYLVSYTSGSEIAGHVTQRLGNYQYALAAGIVFILALSAVRAFVRLERDNARRADSIAARVMETPSAAIVIMDGDRSIVSVNRAFRTLTGFQDVDMPVRSAELFPPLQFRTMTVAAVWDSVFAWGRYEGEAALTRNDGTRLQVWASVASVTGSAGETTGYVMILSDISEIVRLNQQIESQNSFLKILLETMPAPVYFKDANLRYRGCNPAFASVLGRRIDEIIGKTVFDIYPPDEAEAFDRADRELMTNGTTQASETRLRFANDVLHDVIIHKGVLHRPDGTPDGFVGIIFDVTERKRMEKDLQEQADRDALTGALNRRRLWETADHEIQRARRYGHPLTVLMLDIDRFKTVNDNFGHAAGDEVLKAMAAMVNGTLRDTDSFARIGGEEFVVLLPETGPEMALAAAERIRKRIEQTSVDTPAGRVRFTVSIGASSLSATDVKFDEILRRADSALYRAKEGGRNRSAAS